jgi:hypothetical protein
MDLGTVGGAASASGLVSWLFKYWQRRSEKDVLDLKSAVDTLEIETDKLKLEMVRVQEELEGHKRDWLDIKTHLTALQASIVTILVSLGRIEGELKARRERGLQTP